MLSKKCQYALHALVYLAKQERENVSTIQEIAVKKNIPKKFLEIILAELKQAGILASRKGKMGGYYLRKDANDISVLEVIRLVDGAVAMLPCVSLNFYQSCGRCEDEATCSINKLFSKVRDEMLKVLSKNSLQDLIKLSEENKILLPVDNPIHQIIQSTGREK
jgi:Rrf2 family protein